MIVTPRQLREFKESKSLELTCCSGHFTVLHVGAVEYIQEAARLAAHTTKQYEHLAFGKRGAVVVIVNNDEQCRLKGTPVAMPEQERLKVVDAIRGVDYTVLSVDQDRSVSTTLALIRPAEFLNGGDVTLPEQVREKAICEDMGVELVFMSGGKIQSSSNIINRLRGEENHVEAGYCPD